MKNKVITFSGLCIGSLLLFTPVEAKAETAGVLKDMLPTAGIASLYTLELTKEDCLLAAEAAKGAFWGYTNLGIAKVESNLNVRKEPRADAPLVGKMRNQSACEVLEVLDGWAHIKSGEVEGYVSTEYLLMGAEAKLRAKDYVKKVAKVTVSSLKVREEADLSGAVLTLAPQGEELEYVGTVGEWIQVNLDGNEAYVHSDYVTVAEELETAVTLKELRYGEGVTNLRVDIVEYAKQFVGNPYVWGGTSLTKGADCSGFVQSVLKKFNITVSRTSRSQAGDGKKISANELQPGDLVFYANSSGTINHVAMYIGDGKVVHASSPKTGIKISNYNYRTPVKYVDVIKD